MIKKFIPSLEWISKYNRATFLSDLPAGLTVGIMLIPQGMAYAMIAGLPAVYGLYAALVPQIIYAILGTSRQLAVGPVAMDSLLVASGLSVIAVAGSENYILLAILLALLMGVMQFVMGVFRLGFLVSFLSKPVISGFTSAAALIIGLNQLKYLVGVEIARSNQVHLLIMDAIPKLVQTHWLTLGIGLLGIVLIWLTKKYFRKLPAALIVVVVGTLLVTFFGLEDYGVNVVGDIPKGFPGFNVPNLKSEYLVDLMPIALTLSLIAFMEAISVAKAVEQRHNDYKIDPNQELIALGLANVIGSLFQSYPTTGGFSRTAVNDQAGAKTGIAALISAFVVGLTLLFLTPLFYNLPKAVLASIIMMAVFGLIDYKYPLQLFKNQKDQLLLLLTTFTITLTIGIKEGIIVGIVFSILIYVYNASKASIAVLGKVTSGQYKSIKESKEAETTPEQLILRIDCSLFFANSSAIRTLIDTFLVDKKANLNHLILHLGPVTYIDVTAIQMLYQLKEELEQNEIKLSLTNVNDRIRQSLEQHLEKDHQSCPYIIETIDEAIS